MAIYRYFDKENYASALIHKGQMLFRSLSYFRELEDDAARGDKHDGKLRHAPAAGLELKKTDGTIVKLPDCHFVSSANESEIFVSCFSNKLSEKIAAEFNSPFCVEIASAEAVISRLTSRASRQSTLDYANALSGDVEYRVLEKEPLVDWALPEKVAFIKPPEFADQNEFRFVIGKRGALDPENVHCELVEANASPTAVLQVTEKFVIDLGSFKDVAKLHKF
jgi:hypothetical protein